MDQDKTSYGMPCSVTVSTQGTDDSVKIACEHTVNVFINKHHSMRIVCTPQHLEELVAGRLLTENLIDGIDDIAGMTVSGKGLRVNVELNSRSGIQLTDRDVDYIPTCCSDNKVYVERKEKRKRQTGPVKWELSWLENILTRLHEGEPLFLETHAVHSCYLARGSEVICCREDIGRHNAMDKAIGYGLINGTDLSECFLFTTGRMPTDMVRKVIDAGIPLLVSKTYPTDQAVEMANAENVTLITIRENGKVLVWTEPYTKGE